MGGGEAVHNTKEFCCDYTRRGGTWAIDGKERPETHFSLHRRACRIVFVGVLYSNPGEAAADPSANGGTSSHTSGSERILDYASGSPVPVAGVIVPQENRILKAGRLHWRTVAKKGIVGCRHASLAGVRS